MFTRSYFVLSFPPKTLSFVGSSSSRSPVVCTSEIFSYGLVFCLSVSVSDPLTSSFLDSFHSETWQPNSCSIWTGLLLLFGRYSFPCPCHLPPSPFFLFRVVFVCFLSLPLFILTFLFLLNIWLLFFYLAIGLGLWCKWSWTQLWHCFCHERI